MPTKVTGKKLAHAAPASAVMLTTAEQMSEALDLCAKTVQNSRNAAVYKCVLMLATEKRLTVRGTDLSIYIERYLDAKSSGAGVWLVPFEQLYHFVKNVHGKLRLAFGPKELLVAAGRYHATIKLRDPREFTLWPKWDEMEPIKVKPDELMSAIHRSLNVDSDTGVDPILQNVSIKPYKNGSADVQSSNNHRYQFYRLAMKLPAGILIPLSAADIISGLTEVKKVVLRESMIGIETSSSRVMCGLAAGDERYPKFSDMLPEQFTLTVEIDKERMLQTTKLARGFADQKYRRIRLTMDPKTKSLTVESSIQSGGFKSSIELKRCKGKPLSILMDADDLEKFLALCDSDSFNMLFTGPGTQIVLRDTAQDKFRFATHPLIVKDDDKEEEPEAEPDK